MVQRSPRSRTSLHRRPKINEVSERSAVLPLRLLTAIKFISHSLACSTTVRLAPNKHFSIVNRNDDKLSSERRKGLDGIGSPARMVLTIIASYKLVANPIRSVSLNVSLLYAGEIPLVNDRRHVKKGEGDVNVEMGSVILNPRPISYPSAHSLRKMYLLLPWSSLRL